jgi:hypothetical protein
LSVRDNPPVNVEPETIERALAFIQNRLDGVSMDVISWMPPGDATQHHNALEMLHSAWQRAERLRLLLGGQTADTHGLEAETRVLRERAMADPEFLRRTQTALLHAGIPGGTR